MKFFTILALILFVTAQLIAQPNTEQLKNELSLNDRSANLTGSFINKSAGLLKNQSQKEKDFSFTINPYLWTIAVGGVVSHPSTGSYYFDINFTDAVSNLKMAAMVAGRIKYKSVSLLYDLAYIKVRPELNIPVYSGYISGTDEVKQFVTDLSLGYRLPLKEKNIKLDIYGGTRIWSVNNKLDLFTSGGTTYTNEQSKTWIDPIIGICATFNLSKKWFSYLKADIGGFGAASDWTSSAIWGIGVNFSKNWNSSFGIKELYIDYDKEGFMWNVSQYGLLFTLGYQI